MVERPTLSPESDLDLPSAFWVVFSGDTDIRMLRLLRKGFRHCFIMMLQGGRWIMIDPRSNRMDVALLPHPAKFNFPRYFTQQGKTVVKIAAVQTPDKMAPLFPLSCVETVKRILGIHARFVLTPYQLYKHITKGQ